MYNDHDDYVYMLLGLHAHGIETPSASTVSEKTPEHTLPHNHNVPSGIARQNYARIY